LQEEDLTLELPTQEWRRLVEIASRRLADFVDSLPSQPAADTDAEGGAALARSLREPLPEEGQPFEELLELLLSRVVPKSFNTAGPGYIAYIPGGGLLQAALADLIANVTNRYTGVWAAAPGMVQLETNVLSWFSDLAGYPPEARGFFTTGGSLSTLSAVVTARHERLPADFLKGTLYASAETHHSLHKAALLAGFPSANVREVSADERFRVRLDELERRIREDRASGLQPFFLVGNAGTVHTGAVDDLSALADLAARERLWLHVDGAYGGFFLFTERGKQAMAGIERSDSLALDPHKGLFLPYGTGALLVRDGAALRRAHSVHASYLPAMREDSDFVDFCEISPELSKAVRGLRVWLPFKMHGAGPFRRNLDEKLDLALWATEALRGIPGIEIVAEPQLSLVAFRLAGGGDLEEENRANRELMARINARNRVHLTGTVLNDGRFVLRICVLSFRTHLDRMRQGLDDIRASVQEQSGQ